MPFQPHFAPISPASTPVYGLYVFESLSTKITFWNKIKSHLSCWIGRTINLPNRHYERMKAITNIIRVQLSINDCMRRLIAQISRIYSSIVNDYTWLKTTYPTQNFIASMSGVFKTNSCNWFKTLHWSIAKENKLDNELESMHHM